MAEIVGSDERVRWFDHPKGPRHGEVYRHAALSEARGEIVCYLSDDDLWLPHHLQTLHTALSTVDFAHTVHIDVTLDGQIAAYPYDLADPVARGRLLNEAFNFFGLTVAGHTLAAYRRLPHGWQTTPAGLWTDLFMWRQFLEQPWCRARTIWHPSALQFASPPRRHWTLQQRLAELDEWAQRSTEADFEARLGLETLRQRSQAVTARDGSIAALQAGLDEQQRGIDWLRGEIAGRDQTLATLQAELDAVRDQLTLIDHERARLAEAVAELRTTQQQQHTAMTALAAAEAQRRVELVAAEAQLTKRAAELNELYGSRWWRMANWYWRAQRNLKR